MPFLRSVQLAELDAGLARGDYAAGVLERRLLDLCTRHYVVQGEAPVLVKSHEFDRTNELFLPPQRLAAQPANAAQVALFVPPLGHGTVLRIFRRGVDTELLPVEPLPTGTILVEVQAAAPDIYYAMDGGTTTDTTRLLVALFDVQRCRGTESVPGLLEPALSASLKEVQDEFVESSFVQFSLPSLLDGLHPDLLALPTDSWVVAGPYDYRHWHEYPLELLRDGALGALRAALVGDTFRVWIEQLSGLRVRGLQEASLRRITGRCFQIFNEQYDESAGLDVVLSVVLPDPSDAVSSGEGGGSWIYLVDGEKVAEIVPRDGTLSMAYRVEGCTRFLSYVSAKRQLALYQFHLLFGVSEDGDGADEHQGASGTPSQRGDHQ